MNDTEHIVIPEGYLVLTTKEKIKHNTRVDLLGKYYHLKYCEYINLDEENNRYVMILSQEVPLGYMGSYYTNKLFISKKTIEERYIDINNLQRALPRIIYHIIYHKDTRYIFSIEEYKQNKSVCMLM